MTNERERVSKNGLNNIFNTRKKLSRREAARKYHALSPTAREEADNWINNAFYLETGFPQGEKLDPKNPEHSEYIEKWLKQRDAVMGWTRDWEKPSSGNMDTRIFREKISPTTKNELTRNEGIFEQGMSGAEFKKYVIEKINEPAVYGESMNRRDARRPIALSIASKILDNKVWLKNASSSHESKDAMIILLSTIARFPWEADELEAKDRAVYDKLSKVCGPFLEEKAKEDKINFDRNLESFKKSFPALSTQIKKQLESEGHEVEKIYYKNFTGSKIEIRAETVTHTKVEYNTYGYRGDPYVPVIKTERGEFSVGGIDLVSGVFQDARYFNTLGTAETDWGTQLALGELAVLAGIGIRALISGTRSVLIRGGESAAAEAGESLVGREIRDTVEDLSHVRLRPEAEAASKIRLKAGDESVDALADTLKMRPNVTPPPGPFNPNLVRRLDKEVVNDVGETLSTRVLSYGYHPDDLTSFVARLQESGFTRAEIRSNLEKQMQLADKYMDEFVYQPKLQEVIQNVGENAVNNTMRKAILQEAYDDTRVTLSAHEGNITDAIATARFHDKLQEWHRLNDFADGVKNVPGHPVMNRLANEARAFAKQIETEIMGASSASGFIAYRQTREQTKEPKDQRDIKIRDQQMKKGEKKEAKLPRIREKGNTQPNKKPGLRENKF